VRCPAKRGLLHGRRFIVQQSCPARHYSILFGAIIFGAIIEGGVKMERFPGRYLWMAMLLGAINLFSCPTLPVHAAIVQSGNVERSSGDYYYIGKSSVGAVTVNGGSALNTTQGYMGYSSGSFGTATVTGIGSTWTNEYSIYVGHFGSGTLYIEAGGEVNSTLDCILGYGSAATGTATVSGIGSKWTIRDNFRIGSNGTGFLNIISGGQVSNRNGYLGHSYTSGYSPIGTATITGPGSKWENTFDLFVGYTGSGKLTVEDGGLVTARTLYASFGNLFGNGIISANGAVIDADFIFDGNHGSQTSVAFGSNGTLNLTLDGSGALGAGYKGSGTLRITDGAAVKSTSGYIGYDSGSTGTATVTGSGSKWINSSNFYVGYSGKGTLNIEAGGQLTDVNGYLNGSATVTGFGSMWTNSGYFYASGKMTVSDGGTVTASTLYASLRNLSGNGSITTKGAVLDDEIVIDDSYGSQPTIAFGTGGKLTLAADGSGALGAGFKGYGTLRIADGVAIASSFGYLGYNSDSNGTATVTGLGSKWTIISDLYVGRSGKGTLKIESGGAVSDTDGYLNYGNTATVTGVGSSWTNNGTLYVGKSSNGVLNIEAGGQVSSTTGYIGYENSTGKANVKGNGSKWTNSGILFVGSAVGKGSLTVDEGGMVSTGMLRASRMIYLATASSKPRVQCLMPILSSMPLMEYKILSLSAQAEH
jgi:fibronectin-binding autotransporter adhesin